jgi:transcription-repair coupling factor (superfamily II helicase)
MELSRKEMLNEVLVASITPYFLERENFWFEQHLYKILRARKIQSFFEDNTLYLEKNHSCRFSTFLRKLDEMGYEKVQRISEPGEFSRQGGIIDIFPINLNYAVRLEFYGDLIENIEKLPLKIENEKEIKERIKRKLKRQKIFSDLKGVKPGDYLVHLDHGVGKFIKITHDRELSKHFYLLEYAGGDRLYVPLGLERKLSRYIGFLEPKVSRLSSLYWERTKKRAKEEAERTAKELLEIAAKRETVTRPPYLADNEIDFHLENTFPHQETPDQLQVMTEIKKDLEKERPMDRIVCGDVGFGKTEVALRTIIKAVNSGRQAAMICPSTILANQHYLNFKERLGNLPVELASLSRFCTKREQKKIIEGLKDGKIDIVIGTHRILSNDVEFKNLGLLVIDDEQKFGVKQKEKLKKMRNSLDVLSLSATPIPRTLYLALSSLKSISLIQTPPLGRFPVKIFVQPWKKETIKKTIQRELDRRGQIYYLHNRVETIGTAKKLLEELLPKAKIGIAHGRMKEKDLIKTMNDFQQRSIDVLVATTIIENGLDLPNVNTLIVADAARLGLAQAYQIRGRIGRWHRQAFAFFLYGDSLSDSARERLKTLLEAEALGSGYKIALKDLEMRGAGNILGKEQSGVINQVGLNLYCQMLSEAVEKIGKNKS